MRVGIQGENGSFSEEAAFGLLGREITVCCFQHFDEVFRATSSREVDLCVIPLENSLTGSIHRNYDLLVRNGLRIHGEIYLPIVHNLIALPGVRFEDLRRVISHPVALGQCEKFLEEHPYLETEASYDTAGSVRELFERNLRTTGAIAGRRAWEVFGGDILKEGIQDSVSNYTRFVTLSPKHGEGKGDKTSILFCCKNVPGALFKSLSVFALRDIDLTKIESRPLAGRVWEYLFYVDLLGNVREERVENALKNLEEITDQLEILGCYERDQRVKKGGL